MKLVVGLGNPGEKYAKNRHNVGWLAIDMLGVRLKDFYVKKNHSILSTIIEYKIGKERILLVKPLTYMNNSGESVSTLSRFYKVDCNDIYVIHDDLDIKFGKFKIQKGKGPKVHNGILSIEDHLKTSDFYRVRIGVDNRDPENRIPGETYVLQNFTDEEKENLNLLFDKILKELI